jgi:hypothetical protein
VLLWEAVAATGDAASGELAERISRLHTSANASAEDPEAADEPWSTSPPPSSSYTSPSSPSWASARND